MKTINQMHEQYMRNPPKRNRNEWPADPAKFPLGGPSNGPMYIPDAPPELSFTGWDIVKGLAKAAAHAILWAVIALCIGVGFAALLAVVVTLGAKDAGH